MNDFYELERKCKKLQQKKLFKYFIIIFVFLIFIGVYFYIQYTQKTPLHTLAIKKEVPKIKENNITKTNKKIDDVKKIENKKISKKKKENNTSNIQKIISPKIKEKNITKTDKKIDNPKKEKNVTIQKIIKEKNITKPIIQPVLELKIDFDNIKPLETNKAIIQNPKTLKQVKHKSSIVQNETITFLKALTLAKKYYENADYENSIKWCKLASKIDNNDERIWKLYALNLEKIGQKEKAIKVLKTYLKYKNSLDLKYLLQRLENEKN